MKISRVEHPQCPDTFVAIPEGAFFQFHVYELDGTAQEVDLLQYVPLMLSLGEKQARCAVCPASTEPSDGVDFGRIEVSDEVEFFLEGRRLQKQCALEYLSLGLVHVITQAARATLEEAASSATGPGPTCSNS